MVCHRCWSASLSCSSSTWGCWVRLGLCGCHCVDDMQLFLRLASDSREAAERLGTGWGWISWDWISMRYCWWSQIRLWEVAIRWCWMGFHYPGRTLCLIWKYWAQHYVQLRVHSSVSRQLRRFDWWTTRNRAFSVVSSACGMSSLGFPAWLCHWPLLSGKLRQSCFGRLLIKYFAALLDFSFHSILFCF